MLIVVFHTVCLRTTLCSISR